MSLQATTSKPSDPTSGHRPQIQNSIGEIFRDFGEDYIREYSPDLQQIKLIKAIRICKTPTLGGRVIICNSCDHHHYVYHSCGHSHCPICQSIKREQWIDKLKNELLNVPYVHLIFTLPHKLNGLARLNKDLIYSLIMTSSWQTIKELSADLSNVGGLPGMVCVLHTFGSDMKYHIHTHCLVTFGGLNKNNKWCLPTRKDKIARYRKINSTYKSIFLAGLRKLFEQSKIKYHLTYSEIVHLLGDKTWVVHNTKPTIDTTILENYLARYIKRVAVSNSKVDYIKKQAQVKIIYNDYANQVLGNPAPKASKKLNPLIFIDQFMQHVLPPYFQKSRRYGLHSSATKKSLEDSLPDAIKRNGHLIRTVFEILNKLLSENPFQCEKCQSKDFQLTTINPNKEWVLRFIIIPTPRPPPIKPNISCKPF